MTLTVGSLFSGIGGLELGLERAGMQVRWQVEIDPYARKVLEKHWPNVSRFEDVRAVGAHNLQPVDLICGGFPCQDISNAGKRAGIDGERSGLWAEYIRIVREVRPRYVLVENVAALLVRGLERVLGELAESGFDAEWDCIPAAAVGAPHRRDRLFVVAYANGNPVREQSKPIGRCCGARLAEFDGSGRDVADPDSPEWREIAKGRDVSDGDDAGREEAAGGSSTRGKNGAGGAVADASSLRRPQGRGIFDARGSGAHRSGSLDFAGNGECAGSLWAVEPDVGRVAHGVPSRVDRLRCLGNAVVPQVAEFIGRRILARVGQEVRP